ncbi:MAG: methionine--tRNA ligase [Candidatus Blackburnbacteria bacterium]|nr:methionine--tRNA ligase [Candidatus Blackburnbacteria bacterium]
MNKFYITGAIPYVNAEPHIGHALEFVQTDTIARYHRLLGEEVLVLSGGDENALKNVQAAEQANAPIQEFVDQNTQRFYELTKKLNAQFDIWQKGSDKKRHYPSSQKLWELCKKNGDIYKKQYTGLYCVGCETFYSPGELNEKGECFEHPGQKLERVTEENYFFKLSKYQNRLVEIVQKGEYKIVPETRKNEVLSFLESGLEDISISRSNERAKNWGVPVPGDSTQRIYVWFDALNIYQSGVGFGWDEGKYNKWWPADVHAIGKGILRFHAVYWPAFLLSAGLKLPKSLFVHGYFTVDGQKMSKTLGNVVDPFRLVDEYGAEALRYYFLAKFAPFSDGDFSEEKLKDIYNADLANNLGNLVSRVAKLAETDEFDFSSTKIEFKDRVFKDYHGWFKEFRFNEACASVWNKIDAANRFIDDNRPWEKKGRDLGVILNHLVAEIREIAFLLKPFLPETAEKIEKQFKGPNIKSAEPLFPRI